MSVETFERAREYARITAERGYRTGIAVVAVNLITNGWGSDSARSEIASSHAVEYTHDHGHRAWIIWPEWRDDVNRVTYLMDDGLTVVPTYVAGWQPGTYVKPGPVFLNPYPLNVDSTGQPVMRGDGRGPGDYSGWSQPVSRCYHVKIVRDLPALNGEAY